MTLSTDEIPGNFSIEIFNFRSFKDVYNGTTRIIKQKSKNQNQIISYMKVVNRSFKPFVLCLHLFDSQKLNTRSQRMKREVKHIKSERKATT